MKMVRFLGQGKVAIVEAPRPECDEKTVLLKVAASAICGSELARLKGERRDAPGFYNTGHEVVGVIEEAPAGSGFEPGMRVGARVVQGCGECDFCRRGYETACRQRTLYAGNGHAEYFRLGIHGIQPIPDGTDWPQAALLTGDGLGVPVRCSRRLGNTAGKKVVVLGLGPIGLGNVLVQHFKGAEVMGADMVPFRLEFATQLGASRVVNIQEHDLKQAVLDWTSGNGADIVILAVGKNPALLQAVDVLKQQGTLFQVGEMEEATFNPSAAFIRKEITMTGSWYYTSADWEDMLALHHAGLPYGKLITHVFPFAQAQDAFDVFVSGNSGKVILTYDQE